MKKSEVYLPSNDGKNQLHTVIWEPDTEYPRAILQIVHGMWVTAKALKAMMI